MSQAGNTGDNCGQNSQSRGEQLFEKRTHSLMACGGKTHLKFVYVCVCVCVSGPPVGGGGRALQHRGHHLSVRHLAGPGAQPSRYRRPELLTPPPLLSLFLCSGTLVPFPTPVPLSQVGHSLTCTHMLCVWPAGCLSLTWGWQAVGACLCCHAGCQLDASVLWHVPVLCGHPN